MGHFKVRAVSAALSISTVAFAIHASAEPEHASKRPVGLSLFFQNGSVSPIDLIGHEPRHVQELDIVATVTTEDDQGVAPLSASGDLADLDWRGVAFVEEDWRPAADGTFTRQRFYRSARWMEEPSQFWLFATDRHG